MARNGDPTPPKAAAAARPCPPKLLHLAPLSSAEQRLLSVCQRNRGLILSQDLPKRRTEKNQVRSQIIEFLLRGFDSNYIIGNQGLYLSGAVVTGPLHLHSMDIGFPLQLKYCRFSDDLLLQDSSLLLLCLSGSRAANVDADRMTCQGGVFLDDGFVAKGRVRLSGADIKGPVSCIGGRFENSKDAALYLDQAKVGGSVFFREGFHAAGQVRLLGTTIGGNLDCAAAEFHGKNGSALTLDGIRIAGSLLLARAKAVGAIHAIGCKIGGVLDAHSANLENPGGDSAIFDSSEITGSVFLRSGFTSLGKFRMPGALIGGALECSNCRFVNGGGMAISAEGLRVQGRTTFGPNFHSEGTIRLANAGLRTLSSFNAFLSAPGKAALTLDGSEISGSVQLGPQFAADGSTSFVGAHLKGNLSIGPASLRRPGGLALAGEAVRVDGNLTLHNIEAEGVLSFVGAQATNLVDDEASWRSGYILDGFTYQRFAKASTDPLLRAAWLQRQSGHDLKPAFLPQPWEQLAKVLKDMGHFEEAKVVSIEKQKAMRKAGLIGARATQPDAKGLWRAIEWIWLPVSNGLAVGLHWIYGALAGYGYRPIQTAGWMVLSWLLGGAVYWAAARDGMIGPTNVRIYMDGKLSACGTGADPGKIPWTACPAVPAEYTSFSAFIYSLDLSLPVVDLHQESDWAPITRSQRGSELAAGRLLRIFVWVQIVFGWLTSLLLVSALGRLVQGDK